MDDTAGIRQERPTRPALTRSGLSALAAGWRPRLIATRYLLLAALSAVLLWPGITRIPPLDGAESRNAQAAAQMLATGDFVDIRVQDAQRYVQPAGMYWLQAAAVSLLDVPDGRAIWTHRVPGALAAVISVLLTCRIASSLYGASAGFVAGLLLATSVLLGVTARIATVDTAALAAILTAQAALLEVWRRRDGPPARLAPWIFWSALGAGLLLKGPLILLVPAGTLLGLALAERRARWMTALRPLAGTGLIFAMVLPWVAGIDEASRGTFFAQWARENLTGSPDPGWPARPGMFLALFLVTFWPGSLFAVRGLPWVWSNRAAPPTRFLLAWILPAWLAFEALPAKYPADVLPTYPAIAALAAAALCAPQGWRSAGRLLGPLLIAACGQLWLLAGLALALAGPVLLVTLEHRASASTLFAALLAALLVLNGWRQSRRPAPRIALACAVGAMLPISLSLALAVLPALPTVWLAPRIAAAVQALRPCPDSVLATVSYTGPSLVFLTGRDTRTVSPADAAEFLAESPTCGLALIGAPDTAAFAEHARALGLAPRALTRIDGIDPLTLRRLDLTLYTVAPPHPDPGAASPPGR